MVTYSMNHEFMRDIVIELVENELYDLEGRLLTDNEKQLIVDIYNELEHNECPSISNLNEVWDIFYERYL